MSVMISYMFHSKINTQSFHSNSCKFNFLTGAPPSGTKGAMAHYHVCLFFVFLVSWYIICFKLKKVIKTFKLRAEKFFKQMHTHTYHGLHGDYMLSVHKMSLQNKNRVGV